MIDLSEASPHQPPQPDQPPQHTQSDYGLRPEAQAFPMMLVLSLVYPCNAKCPHCPYTNSNIRQSYRDAPYMGEALFKKIADEAGPHGAYLRISGGGEPMLHEQATQLFLYAKAQGCKIGLITNGSLFDEENSRALLAAGVDMIEFSVDAADASVYEEVRKGLDWDTLVTNVKRFLAIRKEIRGVSRIVASGVHQKGVVLDAAEKFWMEEIGIDAFIKRKFLTWGENTTLDGDRSADDTPYIDTDTVPCPFLFERLNIDTRGNVMVCGFDIAAKTSMGNVNDDTIAGIWHGAGFEHYRTLHLENRGKELELCASCPDWRYRSWKHNYWKVIGKAEESRQKKLGVSGEGDASSPGAVFSPSHTSSPTHSDGS
ncbi:MAG: radical SAM protein [Magnetococcales bacterium]|nr:radical SAM protein [Magnetococcales bacterium]